MIRGKAGVVLTALDVCPTSIHELILLKYPYPFDLVNSDGIPSIPTALQTLIYITTIHINLLQRIFIKMRSLVYEAMYKCRFLQQVGR